VSVIASTLDTDGTDWIGETMARLPGGLAADGNDGSNAHLSYHVATEYAPTLVEEVLPAVARSQAPFTVRPSGVIVFTEPEPVVGASIVRSPGLSRIHEAIWDGAGSNAMGTVDRLAPDRWAPHVTLVGGDLDRSELSAVVEALSDVDFDREFVVDNVVCVRGEGEEARTDRFDFER
jgi:2'-5' RNA ligase